MNKKFLIGIKKKVSFVEHRISKIKNHFYFPTEFFIFGKNVTQPHFNPTKSLILSAFRVLVYHLTKEKKQYKNGLK